MSQLHKKSKRVSKTIKLCRKRHFSQDTDIDDSLLVEHSGGIKTPEYNYSSVRHTGYSTLSHKGKVKQHDLEKLQEDLQMLYIRRRVRINKYFSKKLYTDFHNY